MPEPDFVARLKKIKQSLEHARRFTTGVHATMQAATQAEGDIEELLIDYGFQKSDERDPDPNVIVEINDFHGLSRTTTIVETLQ